MGIRLELKFWSEIQFLFPLFKMNKNYLFSESLTALKSGLRQHEMSFNSTSAEVLPHLSPISRRPVLICLPTLSIIVIEINILYF